MTDNKWFKSLVLFSIIFLAAACNKAVVKNDEPKKIESAAVASSTETSQADEIANLKKQIEDTKNQKPQTNTIIHEVIKEVPAAAPTSTLVAPQEPQPSPTSTIAETKKYTDDDLKNWNTFKQTLLNLMQTMKTSLDSYYASGFSYMDAQSYTLASQKFSQCVTAADDAYKIAQSLVPLSLIPETTQHKTDLMSYITAKKNICKSHGDASLASSQGYYGEALSDLDSSTPYNDQLKQVQPQLGIVYGQIIKRATDLGLPTNY